MVMDNQDPIERGLYAVAAALEKISGSINELSHAVDRLGNADPAWQRLVADLTGADMVMDSRNALGKEGGGDAMTYTPEERIAAAKKSLADLRSNYARWRAGKDSRDALLITIEMDDLAHVTFSYLNGEPGPYLDGTAGGPPRPSSLPKYRMQG